MRNAQGEQAQRKDTEYPKRPKSLCAKRVLLVRDLQVGKEKWGAENRRCSVARGGIDIPRETLAIRSLPRGAPTGETDKLSKRPKVHVRKAGASGV